MDPLINSQLVTDRVWYLRVITLDRLARVSIAESGYHSTGERSPEPKTPIYTSMHLSWRH